MTQSKKGATEKKAIDGRKLTVKHVNQTVENEVKPKIVIILEKINNLEIAVKEASALTEKIAALEQTIINLQKMVLEQGKGVSEKVSSIEGDLLAERELNLNRWKQGLARDKNLSTLIAQIDPSKADPDEKGLLFYFSPHQRSLIFDSSVNPVEANQRALELTGFQAVYLRPLSLDAPNVVDQDQEETLLIEHKVEDIEQE